MCQTEQEHCGLKDEATGFEMANSELSLAYLNNALLITTAAITVAAAAAASPWRATERIDILPQSQDRRALRKIRGEKDSLFCVCVWCV